MTRVNSALPEGTQKEQRSGYEEVIVPALKKQARNDHLIPIKSLPEWAQPAFNGMDHLNPVQSKVCETALYSSVCSSVLFRWTRKTSCCALLPVLVRPMWLFWPSCTRLVSIFVKMAPWTRVNSRSCTSLLWRLSSRKSWSTSPSDWRATASSSTNFLEISTWPKRRSVRLRSLSPLLRSGISSLARVAIEPTLSWSAWLLLMKSTFCMMNVVLSLNPLWLEPSDKLNLHKYVSFSLCRGMYHLLLATLWAGGPLASKIVSVRGRHPCLSFYCLTPLFVW